MNKVLQSLNLKTEKLPYAEALHMVERREVLTALFTTKCCLIACLGLGIKERYDAIKRVELHLQGVGYHMGYAADQDAPFD